MKKNFKRMICLFVCVLLITNFMPIRANANSAQSHWRGVDSTGAMVVDGDCPIVVTNEVLTFDLLEFPEPHYFDKDDFLAYSGKVTAEYTFFNPTDLTITATLAFPFGKQPDYSNITNYGDEQDYPTSVDAERFGVTINGEQVERRIRHTLQSDVQFNLGSDLPRLKDSYTEDSFYSPDMTVTKYNYTISGIVQGYHNAENAAFDWDGGDGRTRILFPDQSGFSRQNDGDGRFSTWADNGDNFCIYAIGEPLSSQFEWTFYEDGGVKDGEEVAGEVTLVSTQTLTLEDLVLEKWSESTGISKVDWYNAVIDGYNQDWGYKGEYNMVSTSYLYRFESHLLRWYEYEITLLPQASIVNSVTAPMYPEIDLSYDPDIYSYTYLLSPATTWADFFEIEIIINTPFYITANSIEGFTKTENGYSYRQSGLPNGELEFTLSTGENPTKPRGMRSCGWR